MPIKGMPGGSVSGCIEKEERRGRVKDPGAYCAAIADRIEPGWREKSVAKKKKKKKKTRKKRNPRTPAAATPSRAFAGGFSTAAIKRNFFKLDEDLL